MPGEQKVMKGKAEKNLDVERRIQEANEVLRRRQRSNIDPVKELRRDCVREERKSQ